MTRADLKKELWTFLCCAAFGIFLGALLVIGIRIYRSLP